jgi:hypothetical protein
MNKKLLGVWRTMHNRCYNINVKSYKYYGAKGIIVCERWHGKQGFDNFIIDMGPKSIGDSVDRINPTGNYEPSNCRWATKLEQANNKSNNTFITANGETKTLAQWAAILGCSPAAITYRLKKGMHPDLAVSMDIPKRPNSKLSDEDVIFIRSTYPAMTFQAIADKLSVNKKTVLNVVHNRIFTDIKIDSN